jgi:hypothetical protein
MGILRNVRVRATVSSHLQYELPQIGGKGKMATQLCQKCKRSHPGRVCDHDEKGECAETISVNEVAAPLTSPQKTKED